MKYVIFSILLIYLAVLSASLADYQSEFGFPMDKPRHGKYYFQRELFSIEQDPQIINYQPSLVKADFQPEAASSMQTELDNFSLSDTTLVINTDALNDLDLFSSLKMDFSLGEDKTLLEPEEDYQFKFAEPADYNLYIKMEIPALNAQAENQIDFIPVTSRSRQELQLIIPQILSFSYQLDNIYNNENMILPQYGSIDFIITIDTQGITEVDYQVTAGQGFSNSFISKCRDAIRRWQISSPVKVQYVLSRNYLLRP
ncbi:MAG: hypothetical protein K9M99_08540 [Candidatus Cloacimonetes bacterium]|nr:hypothetical protein [Candidatus Cloacimonadota bacterium]